jgi:5-methylcytosine-specific restriction protein A
MPWSRTSRHARGYGTEWNKLRLRILERDKYLCQSCLRTGRVTAANIVDHIKPKAQGGTDDEENLEAICRPCHDDKTVRDSGGRPKQAIGADGWPV